VPLLGRIPILGNLFRSRKTDKVKTNLLIFIRAKILRDASQMSIETNAKYRSIQTILQGNQEAGIALMPGQDRPTLPPLDESPSQDQGDSNSDE
jgi:general secretion pathway protein D